MAEVPPVWWPQAGGPSVHPRSGGRDREAECAGAPGRRGDRWGTIDLVHADRRIGRRSTAASDGEGPLNGPEAGQISRISREARPSPGDRRPARGQAHTRPLTPPVAGWAAVGGGVAVLAVAAGSRAVGRRWASRGRGDAATQVRPGGQPGIALKTTRVSEKIPPYSALFRITTLPAFSAEGRRVESCRARQFPRKFADCAHVRDSLGECAAKEVTGQAPTIG